MIPLVSPLIGRLQRGRFNEAVEYHQQTTTKHATGMRNDSLAEKKDTYPIPHDLIL